MTRQSVIYTDHARQRMVQRDISTGQVEQTVYEYDYSVASFEGRHIATKKMGDRTINVVYKAKSNNIIIIYSILGDYMIT